MRRIAGASGWSFRLMVSLPPVPTAQCAHTSQQRIHAPPPSPQEQRFLVALIALGQGGLFASWPKPGKDDAKKRKLVAQLQQLDTHYPRGLSAYISNARRLLKDATESAWGAGWPRGLGGGRGEGGGSRHGRTTSCAPQLAAAPLNPACATCDAGKNAFEGYTPSVPHGERLDFGSKEYLELEQVSATLQHGQPPASREHASRCAACRPVKAPPLHCRCALSPRRRSPGAACVPPPKCAAAAAVAQAGVQPTLTHTLRLQGGLHEVGHAAFVLVAGGLGERLGYSGIKVRALSAGTASKASMRGLCIHDAPCCQ